MAVLAAARGSHALGTTPLGGSSPAVIVPPVEVTGLAGFAFNDRYQIVIVSTAGVAETPPEMRYWSVQPPDWSSVLPAGDRERLIPFFALDEDGDPVLGTVELPAVRLLKGQDECTVAGVIVEFVARPWTLGDFDGGLEPLEPVGLEVYVSGLGQPTLEREVGTGGLKSGVIVSDTCEWFTTAAEVADDQWPNYMTAFFPCRIDTHVREVRIGLTLRHVQLVSAEVYGIAQPGRFT